MTDDVIMTLPTDDVIMTLPTDDVIMMLSTDHSIIIPTEKKEGLCRERDRFLKRGNVFVKFVK